MVQKVFPADLKHLYEMLDFINNFGLNYQVSHEVMGPVILAAEEALVNIITYAYPNEDKGTTVDILCEIMTSSSGMKLVIKDHGIPFNPIEKISTPLPKENFADPSVGGYGLYLLIGLMDEISYERVDGNNILFLVKNRKSH